MNKVYNNFVKQFGEYNFIKGINYNSSSVKLVNIDFDGSYYNKGYFKVRSERTNEIYNVMVEADIEIGEFCSWSCSCPQFHKTDMCKHVAACMLKYYTELMNNGESLEEHNLKVSKGIIDKFYKPRDNKIRKRLNLEITIIGFHTWQGCGICVKFRIGENKLYSLNGKMNQFLEAYKNEGVYQLTTKFCYDASEYYFDEVDKKILDYVVENSGYGNNHYGVNFENRYMDGFLLLLRDKQYYIGNDGLYRGIHEKNPFNMCLKNDGKYYVLEFTNFSDFKILTDYSRYIYDDKFLYKLPKKVFDLYRFMRSSDIDSLTFDKKDLGRFTDGVLKVVKDSVYVDESASDVVIATSPDVKLYFDFYYNAIECKVELLYGSDVINLFDKTANIVRDNELESNIFEKLSSFGFISDDTKQRFLLEDIDLIGEFLEENLASLSDEYEVFTSQKIKDTNIIKNTSASANFSIGSDNIMSYDFSVDGVKDDELADLLESMRAKKKYYRLKSGALVDLENNSELSSLNDLAIDMELASKDISGGTIPKYRAIYFDSLKRKRYGDVIRTNNLFDNLIASFNAYKDLDIDLSKKELSILRDYQLTGVKWLYNIYKCGFGGILADEMGLGKSIQLIYLIKLIVKENPSAKILIVAPTSLVYNWKKEFDKFGSELKYKVLAENREQRLNDLNNIFDINVLITTYGLVRNDIDKYSTMKFDLMAIDEAQNIKNNNAQMTRVIKGINSDVKVALTGTPLENSVMELWSIFDFIMPGYLANNKKFKSLYNIKDVDDESLRRLDSLNMQITYFILRRKKKDVVKELPDKIENNIYIDLGKTQKKLYAAEVMKTRKEMDELMATEGFSKARFKILQLLTRLRQICIDPSIVFDNYDGGRAKIDELIRVVLNAKENGHKVLVFTTYKTALDIALKEFSNNGISAYSIDGSISSRKRMELVEKFNEDDTDVFIITLKAGGTGLNLTAATVVVHLDLWWNPQVENQATDRAHRIGQRDTVEVIRLIASGTIEERILELQEKKRKLADALIEGNMRSENQFSQLTEGDIQMLLSMDNEEDVLA